MSEKRWVAAKAALPRLKVYSEPIDLIASDDIQAVAVVTPALTHYKLARAALTHGKHIFVEKPFTANARQAEELIDLARRNSLIIMVDHTFLFTGAVRKIKELIDAQQLGSHTTGRALYVWCHCVQRIFSGSG